DKLLSYAHALSDHSAAIVDTTTGEVSLARLKELIQARQSIFEGHDLEVRSLTEQPLLPSIMKDLDAFEALILEPPAP
ncbi:hypothetical protein JYU02_01170, partial [bacterium AH-315-P15]|nr:hypothetical protein [bacterium AH-315-P15]